MGIVSKRRERIVTWLSVTPLLLVLSFAGGYQALGLRGSHPTLCRLTGGRPVMRQDNGFTFRSEPPPAWSGIDWSGPSVEGYAWYVPKTICLPR